MDALARHWWILSLRGVVGIFFGLMFFVWPVASLAALVLIFGAWVFADGVLALAASITGRRAWDGALEGVLGIVIGVMTFARPGIAGFTFYTFIAVWALVTGVLKLIAAARLRREIDGEFWLALSGVASVIFGVLMLALPETGMLAIAWLIGSYAIIVGLLVVALSLRVRSLKVAM